MTLVLTSRDNFEKCGEILTGWNVSGRLFELKCVFCNAAFLSLPMFVDHINERHLDLLLKEEQSEWIPNFHDCSDGLEDNTNIIKVENSTLVHDEKLTNESDPLNESILKVEPIKDDFLIEALDESNFHESRNNSNHDDFETKSMLSESSDAEADSEREITLSLITGYRELPVLWDVKHSHFKKPRRRDFAIKSLATSLTIQFGKQFQDSDIEKRLCKLQRIYKKDLSNQEAAKLNGESFTTCWYFEKLDFLKDSLKMNDAAFEKTSKSIEKHLSGEQQIQIIEIYESFPCLWNTQHIGYHIRSKRKAAMKEMLRIIEEKMQLKLTEYKLNRKLYRIRLLCTKEKTQKLKCEHKGARYKPQSDFYSKAAFLHDHVTPFKCSQCSKIIKSYDEFQKHVSSHSGKQPFSCTICQRGFTSIGPLNIHIRRHRQDFEFKCKDCGKGFIFSNDLSTHLRVHTGEKPFCCEICGKSFAQERGFKRHKKFHEKRYSYFCELCKKGFIEKNALTDHMNIHLNVRDKICNVCGKAFTTNAYLRKHKETHNEKKKYICKICSKSFAQYAGLFTHKKMH